MPTCKFIHIWQETTSLNLRISCVHNYNFFFAVGIDKGFQFSCRSNTRFKRAQGPCKNGRRTQDSLRYDLFAIFPNDFTYADRVARSIIYVHTTMATSVHTTIVIVLATPYCSTFRSMTAKRQLQISDCECHFSDQSQSNNLNFDKFDWILNNQ